MVEPQVSIIVPVHNCEMCLTSCLDSLMAQTFLSLEFILINNGSTDGSERILKRYTDADERFVLIIQDNQGVSGSRNAGLRAARGQYIGFVDADDYIDSDMVERMYRCAEETQSDVICCDYFLTFPQREEGNILQMQDAVVDVSEMGTELIYLRYLARNPVVWNKLYRRKIIGESGAFFEGEYGEDLLFNLKLAPFIRRISTVGESKYHYVQRRSSLSHSVELNPEPLETLFSHYLGREGEISQYPNLPYYAFACVFTGFMFSSYCVAKDLKFFRKQIDIFKRFPYFNDFCNQITKTDHLKILYLERVISKRFYRIEKILFFLCLHHWDCFASFFMWLCARLIVLKKRKLAARKFY